MQEVSPETPEERGKRSRLDRSLDRVRPGSKAFAVLKRVALGVYSDGFIHAGNLAYLALLTLFPFFIILAALAQFFGHGPDTTRAIDSFLRTVPASVGDLLRKPITDVLAARTGSLLWLGALVGLWTVGSFIETIRDILRRAYGTGYSRAFWHYRLTSGALIIVSVILSLVAFSAQVLLTAAEQFINRLLPFLHRVDQLDRLHPAGAVGRAGAGAVRLVLFADADQIPPVDLPQMARAAVHRRLVDDGDDGAAPGAGAAGRL